MANIKALDLNLLRVFDTLMHERSVTRTADRLGLSQPAVSAALGRLRKQLGDQLLVRARTGMRPTPRAQEIAALVAQSLSLIQDALQSGASFAPERAERSFTVMMSDIGELIYLPRLIERLRNEAPGVRLLVRRLARPRAHEELASGAVDLAIGWMDRVADLNRANLFREDFVCIVRRAHPRVRRQLSPAQFAKEWHLAVGREGLDPADRGDDTVGEGLAAPALRGRRIAMLVPHFLAVPNIIAATDLVCVVPRQLGELYAVTGTIRVVPLPIALPSFEVSLFWHKRFDADQGSVWLRSVIRELFQQKRTRNHVRK